MQEFDPQFPTGRKGWHGREMRARSRDACNRFDGLSLEDFAAWLPPLLLRLLGC